jgi:hypothetical protein
MVKRWPSKYYLVKVAEVEQATCPMHAHTCHRVQNLQTVKITSCRQREDSRHTVDADTDVWPVCA